METTLTFYPTEKPSFQRTLYLEFIPDFISIGDVLYQRETLRSYREVSTYLIIKA
jgi:hypothetical protein